MHDGRGKPRTPFKNGYGRSPSETREAQCMTAGQFMHEVQFTRRQAQFIP
jgi:hypothetical protein